MSLSPLSSIFGHLLEARARRYATGRSASHRLARPVISVGNLTLGGTGKTPFVEFLARRLRFEGRRPAILSRGYGRSSRGVVVVSTGEGPRVDASEGGDEPVELARRLTGVIIVVARHRLDAAREAERLGADLFLLDDGYQHLRVQRDVNLLLLDARDPFGGGRFPPGGRLREPLSALSRADAFIFTRVEPGAPSPAARRTVERWNRGAPIFTARIRPVGVFDEKGSALEDPGLATRRFVAVCGIAQPDTFTTALAELDLFAEARIVFGDHHRYRNRDLARIALEVDRTGSSWVLTTEKDAGKLRGRLSLPIATVRLAVDLVEPGFFAFLTSCLEPAFPQGALPGGR
ncbi:MAG TPA: tetraacyldisaccharide 4'-kinase [Thermoanaerobaculia bacterium]|nr:tetraacyldisaccharide 4'-kinase [Thermoanaerobaculia bacterium]